MKMLNLKTAEEIECIRESALIVSKTLGMLAKEVRPPALIKRINKALIQRARGI